MKNYLILTMLKSKKVWYTLAAIIVPFIARSLEVDEIHVSEIFWSILALLGVTGLQDFGKEAK